MKILTGGCRVYSAEDGQVSTLGNWTARTVISQNSGAQRITQTVSDYAPGLSPAVVNPRAEEVLYVAARRREMPRQRIRIRAQLRGCDFCSSRGGLQHREHRRGDHSSGQLVLPRGPAASHRGWSAAGGVRQPPRLLVHEDLAKTFAPARTVCSATWSIPTSAANRSPSSRDGFRRAKPRSTTTPMKKAFSSWKATGLCTPTTNRVNSGLAAAFTSP
jgi:hypothetical protein